MTDAGEVDLLIVGGGPAVVGAAQDFAARGVRALLIDEQPRDQLGALAGLPPETEVLAPHSVWGVFPAAAGTGGVTLGILDRLGARTFLMRAQVGGPGQRRAGRRPGLSRLRSAWRHLWPRRTAHAAGRAASRRPRRGRVGAQRGTTRDTPRHHHRGARRLPRE